MALTFIDLFCGIGTIRMGMEQAGHKCAYSVEWDKHKRKIYSIIFGKEPEGADIRTVHANDIPRSDVWAFGAPCQDFSIAGKREGMEGERSSLVLEVFRLVRETKEEDRPKYLIYENVKGMLSSNGGRDFLGILDQMVTLGYDQIEYSLLNSKNFGVPQNRERVFVIGHFGGKGTGKVFPIFHSVDCKNPAVCLTVRGYGGQRNGTYVTANPVTETISIDLKSEKSSTRRGMYKKEYVGALDTDCNVGITKDQRIRKLTPKECWRLQGVLDEITDKVIQAGISDTQMYRGAGDACTVNVIYEIAKKLT